MTVEANSPSGRSRVLIAAAITTLVVVAAVIGVAIWRARGSGSSAQPDASATVRSASPSASGPEQQAAQQAMAAYNGFREAYISAAATGEYRTTDLAKYAGDPLLLEARLALQIQSQQGIVNQGRPSWSAHASQVNLGTRPYSVTLEDCFDQTNWQPVYKATGKSAAAGDQAQRYIITSTALLYDDGRWLITESKADRSKSC